MPGFGALPEGTDIKKMLAQIFGENEQPADGDAASLPAGPKDTDKPEAIAPPATKADVAASAASANKSAASALPAGDRQVAESNFVHRTNNTASHNSNADDEIEERKKRRQHGSALPQ